LTPKASCTTITAPRGTPLGAASNTRMGPSEVLTSVQVIGAVSLLDLVDRFDLFDLFDPDAAAPTLGQLSCSGRPALQSAAVAGPSG
jgi:hypothetical protein